MCIAAWGRAELVNQHSDGHRKEISRAEDATANVERQRTLRDGFTG
jgi:hypothetical protein